MYHRSRALGWKFRYIRWLNSRRRLTLHKKSAWKQTSPRCLLGGARVVVPNTKKSIAPPNVTKLWQLYQRINKSVKTLLSETVGCRYSTLSVRYTFCTVFAQFGRPSQPCDWLSNLYAIMAAGMDTKLSKFLSRSLDDMATKRIFSDAFTWAWCMVLFYAWFSPWTWVN